jgi:hypothetical protein
MSCHDLQEEHQKLVCNQSKSVSQSGGWCPDTEILAKEHVTDERLAAALSELFAGASVVGLGDGLGHYNKLLRDSGAVSRYDSYDGTPDIEQITKGIVRIDTFNHHMVKVILHTLVVKGEGG